MNHCVPEWDLPCRDLDVRMHSTCVTSTSKSKWSFAEKRPENDFEKLCWENGQHFAMQSGNEKLQKQRHCPVQPSCDILTIPHCEGAVPTSRFNVCEKNGMIFDDAVIRDALVTDAPVTGKCLEDDDLVSWIQYQAEEPLDNCNELLTGINKATFIWNDIEAPVYSVSRKESVTNATSGKPMDNPCYDSLLIFPSDNLEMAVSSNTASGSIIHASSLPCRMNAFFTQSEPSLKQAPSIPSFPCSTNTNSGGNSSNTLNTAIPRSALSCEMPPPKKRQGTGSDWSQSQYGNSGLMNFPQFSRPAATLKARLNAYRLSSGMDQSKQLDKPAIEARVSAESSAESSITDMSLSGNPKDTSLPSAAALKPHKLESENHLENLPSRNEIVCCANDPAFTNYRAGNVSRALNSCSTSNPLSSTEKETVSNALGHTLASTSKGSGGSDIKTGDSLQKRKNQEAECSECQSDDPDDEPDDLKKPSPAKMASVKRSRAAEIHNLSERRRRDRINEKMKALQELIPNCNKTDKASLLEEVIEYLKMLQTQLQVMTYRTGMGMSPMLMPPAMQHLQMAQLAAMPHWGMGMGMGMGMGVGMNMEMMEKAAASASRHILPFPSFPGLLVPGSAVLPMPGSIPMSTPGSTVFSSAVSALPSEFAGTPFCATPHLARFPSAAVDLPPSSHKVDSIYQNLQPPNTNMYNTSGINQHHHRLPDKYATAGPSPQ